MGERIELLLTELPGYGSIFVGEALCCGDVVGVRVVRGWRLPFIEATLDHVNAYWHTESDRAGTFVNGNGGTRRPKITDAGVLAERARRVRERKSAWAREHAESGKKWRAANGDRVKAAAGAWREANRERVNRLAREAARERRAGVVRDLVATLVHDLGTGLVRRVGILND